MAVKGADKLAQRLRQMPEILEERVKAAIKEGAEQALADMRAMTPLDAANPGAHARDGLTIVYDKDGLAAHIGLPTTELAADYFWFRFLDGGTKGGEVTYRRAGSVKLHAMQVPARPALHIREKTLDANRDDFERLVRQAVDSMRKG